MGVNLSTGCVCCLSLPCQFFSVTAFLFICEFESSHSHLQKKKYSHLLLGFWEDRMGHVTRCNNNLPSLCVRPSTLPKVRSFLLLPSPLPLLAVLHLQNAWQRLGWNSKGQRAKLYTIWLWPVMALSWAYSSLCFCWLSADPTPVPFWQTFHMFYITRGSFLQFYLSVVLIYFTLQLIKIPQHIWSIENPFFSSLALIDANY